MSFRLTDLFEDEPVAVQPASVTVQWVPPIDRMVHFYVDGKLEFGLHCPESVHNADDLMRWFLKDKEWVSWSDYCCLELVSWSVRNDGIGVDLTTKTVKRVKKLD